MKIGGYKSDDAPERTLVFRWMPWVIFFLYLICCLISWPYIFEVVRALEAGGLFLFDWDKSHRVAVFIYAGGLVFFVRIIEFFFAWYQFGGGGKISGASKYKSPAVSSMWGLGVAVILIVDPNASFAPLRSLRHFLVFAVPVYIAVSALMHAAQLFLFTNFGSYKGRSGL